MAKFNKPKTIKEKLEGHATVTKNLAGGLAFKPNAELDLILRAVTSLMGKNKYYQSGAASDRELDEAITTVLVKNPEYILKLALFCRTEMYLRSLPVWLLARYATSGANLPNVRHYVGDVVQRADEIPELLAAVTSITSRNPDLKKKVPNFINYGLRAAYNKFDGYQLAKYNKDGEFKLKDGIMLTHPKPKNDIQQSLFDKLIADTLESPDTWEVATSTKGSTTAVWSEILPKMGHMAVLRNLRNLLKKGADIDAVCAQLTNKEAVLKGKQFPFRYLTAYKAIDNIYSNDMGYGSYIDGMGKVKDALQTCMDISVANVPKIKGKTLILIDNSGSMTSSRINKDENSDIRNRFKKKHGEEPVEMYAADIAGLFGAMSAGVCEKATVVAFGTIHKVVSISLRDGILTNAEKIRRTDVDHNTYGHLPIMHATEKKLVYDRIILFSDMQCYSMNTRSYSWERNTPSGGINTVAEAFTEYQRKVNPNAYLHTIDLTGYGTTLLPENAKNVCAIGGWSDKIFQFIDMFEMNRQGLVDAVNNYQPRIKQKV
jgi:hypothetical protein